MRKILMCREPLLVAVLSLAAVCPLARAGPPADSVPEPQSEVDQQAPEVEPVPLGDIPERARSTASIVRRSTARAAPQERYLAIARDFATFSDGCESLLATTREIVKVEASPGIVRNLRSAWVVARRRVDGWQSELKSRSKELQSDLAALSQESAVWQATRDSAAEQRLPDAIASEIDRIQASIMRAQEAVIARRNEILKLQAPVSELGIALDQIDEELRVVEDVQRGRLLRLDGPPIWKPASVASRHEEAIRGTSGEGTEVAQVFSYYLSEVLAIVREQTALFALALAALVLLRRRAAGWMMDEEASIRSLGHVIRRPFSTALLLTVLATTAWHIDAPEFLLGIAWYLLVIPLVRIVPCLVSPAAKPGVWLLAGLILLDGTVAFLPTYSITARLLVLTVLATAGAGLLWLDRLLGSRPSSNTWSRAAVIAIRLGLFLFAIAFVGEVIGAVGLSRFLKAGVLMSAYGAVLIYGALLVLKGLLQVILRSRGVDSILSGGERATGIQERLSAGLNWLGLALFALVVLNAFHVVTPIRSTAASLMARRITIGAIGFTVGSVFTVVAIVLGAAVLSRVLRFLLAAGFYGRIAVQRGTAESVSKLLHYAVLTVAFLLALGAAGIDLTKVTILAGALGVGVGFGLQNIVSNFISGLILLFERPLHVGDKITVRSTSGEVKDIGIRASTIRTWDGGDVVIPNASLISDDFTNWTLSDNRRRSELAVGAAYGTEPAMMLRLLNEIALNHPLVLKEPAPTPLFTGFGESSLQFILQYWTLLEHQVRVGSELHVAVNERLAEEGIEIPFPQRDLNLRNVDPALLRATPAESEGPTGEPGNGP
jgi:small-conductance mechanosensitive channel